jgi:hypothetical protein
MPRGARLRHLARLTAPDWSLAAALASLAGFLAPARRLSLNVI